MTADHLNHSHLFALPARARLTILVALLVTGLAGRSETGPWKSFVSTRFGYTAHYPSCWYLLEPDLKSLYIVNFPPEKRVKAVVLPKNGASIAIVGKPPRAKTLAEWIDRESRYADQCSRQILTLRDDQTGRTLLVTEVTRDWTSEPQPFFQSIDCYFEIDGLPLAARLDYRRGDPNAASYRTILHQVVLTVRTLSPR